MILSARMNAILGAVSWEHLEGWQMLVCCWIFGNRGTNNPMSSTQAHLFKKWFSELGSHLFKNTHKDL